MTPFIMDNSKATINCQIIKWINCHHLLELIRNKFWWVIITASIATLMLLVCNPQCLPCKQVLAGQHSTFILCLQYIKLFNDSIRCVPSPKSIAEHWNNWITGRVRSRINLVVTKEERKSKEVINLHDLCPNSFL